VPDSEDQLASVPTTWPHRDTSRFITSGDLRWHVQRAGRGPTIVLIHGTAGATHTWHAVLPLLTPWADVIAIDLPGHGFTTGAATAHLSLDGMTDAVHALLAQLDVRPVIGVGHSAGAAILLQLALTRELAPQSIIGINSALVSINALGQLLQPITRAVFDVDFVTDIVAALLQPGTFARALLRSTASPLDADQEARYVSLLTDETRVRATLRMMARWDLPALQAQFPQLTAAVTLMHSRNEPWVDFDALMDATRLIPNRHVVDVTPAGHLIPDELPQRVADVVAAAFAAAFAALRDPPA
jgi:magnesium chelatase accessory protein